ncbi:MAG: TolC family protein, partial [Labilithrix sp.]|nr:TolC family protein [Labilithrix sp.]
MSRFASALAGALGLVVGWPAVASGEPAATVTVTTEERLVATARAQNRELRVRSADRDVAKAGERTAAAIANPSVRLEWLHAQEGNPFDSGWGVGLSWKPPQPGVWSAQRKEAEANTRAVELETLESAAELEAAVRAGWATCAELGALYEVADRAVATRRSIQELVAERVERGAATRIELSAASLSVTRAEQERDEIGVERESARRRLAALAGLPAGSVV